MSGILEHAERQPDKPAFVLGDSEFVETYAELEQRSRRIANALLEFGLQPGDGIALLMANHPEFFDVFWATQRIGLYLTPLNWHLSGRELADVVRHCEARAVIGSSDFEDQLEYLARHCESQIDLFLSIHGNVENYAALEPAVEAIAPQCDLEVSSAGSVMLYSSGTTGKPKGIRKPLPSTSVDDPAYVEAQTKFIRLIGFTPEDRYLCPAPLYHAAPLRSCSAMQSLGGTVYGVRRFDAETALAMIERERITVSQWVPTHFKRLLDLPARSRARDCSSLRLAVHAAAPCPLGIKRQMIDWWGEILLEYYAGTEGGGTLITSREWLEHPGSVGRAWPGAEISILSGEGNLVKTPGVEGVVYIRDASGTGGFSYFKDEQRTREAYRGEQFTLGDVGVLDEEGYLYLTDRRSNLIISGGVNIYPQETENCLMEHPLVYDVAVVGVPDEEMGEAVKAFVVPHPTEQSAERMAAILMEHARANIAHYKCPRFIEFVNELPRTETGKLIKRRLVERDKAGDRVPAG